MIHCRDGTIVHVMSNFIHAREGMYVLTGTMLTGPGGTFCMNVRNVDEAVGIVVGSHGGRAF